MKDIPFVLLVAISAPFSIYLWIGVIRHLRSILKLRAQIKERDTEVEEWRRERYRAPIVKVGTLTNGMPNPDWIFYFYPGNPIVVQTTDPLTSEIVIFGYSPAELAEIAQAPSEFERPELVDWPKEY